VDLARPWQEDLHKEIHKARDQDWTDHHSVIEKSKQDEKLKFIFCFLYKFSRL